MEVKLDPVEQSLLVTGSRSIQDQVEVWRHLDSLPRRPTLLIHGGAIGVDTLAGAWAKARGIPVKVVHPDTKKWPIAKHRWKCYTERDREMVDMADVVVAIWDGHSTGTKLTMDYAKEKLSATFIVKPGKLTKAWK